MKFLTMNLIYKFAFFDKSIRYKCSKIIEHYTFLEKMYTHGTVTLIFDFADHNSKITIIFTRFYDTLAKQ